MNWGASEHYVVATVVSLTDLHAAGDLELIGRVIVATSLALHPQWDGSRNVSSMSACRRPTSVPLQFPRAVQVVATTVETYTNGDGRKWASGRGHRDVVRLRREATIDPGVSLSRYLEQLKVRTSA